MFFNLHDEIGTSLRIIQVIPHVGNEASGPSYSGVRLSQSLALLNNEVLLLSVKDGQLKDNDQFSHRVYRKCSFPDKLWRSPRLLEALRTETKSASIVHSHGMWVMPNVYPGWATRRTAARLVISPRGTLSNWALSRSEYIKRLFWRLLQEPAIRHADCFHATAESEYEDVRRLGFCQPVCIIPNGIDVPEFIPKTAKDIRTLLFLGRVHPKKGIDILLHAWRAVMDRYSEWRLRIVGPDNEGYLPLMQKLAIDLKLERVEFAGPLFGEDKITSYREAELFVMPTHSENFGIVVAEALASGTPAIVTNGAPWAGLNTHSAGWWIDIGVDPLVACLEKTLAMAPHSLAGRGAAGREWMLSEFSWGRVATMMDGTYRWLLKGGEAPSWVKIH